jgi:hypothetical protein
MVSERALTVCSSDRSTRCVSPSTPSSMRRSLIRFLIRAWLGRAFCAQATSVSVSCWLRRRQARKAVCEERRRPRGFEPLARVVVLQQLIERVASEGGNQRLPHQGALQAAKVVQVERLVRATLGKLRHPWCTP